MEADVEKLKCGIVMPISSIDGCNEGHWSEVLSIISDAIEAAGFDGNLVSNADDVGIIQKRIIQNLHDNPIVVCDVSGKNPNVMFELGIRLAFDKPTLIIKDDKTSYSFDTSAIEHLEYPRDLRFSRITDFKEKLSAKIKATYDKSVTDPSYTTFLKHFGEFKVAKIDKKEVSGQELIIDDLKNIKNMIERLERVQAAKENFGQGWASKFKNSSDARHKIIYNISNISKEEMDKVIRDIIKIAGAAGVMYREMKNGMIQISVDFEDSDKRREISDYLTSNFPSASGL